MPQCNRCGNPTQSTDVKCPTCRAELKAFGHTGIELHRATGDAALCDTCTYHADDSCDYAKRPFAQDCTLYRDINQQIAPIHRPGARPPQSPILPIVGVILVILLIAIVMR